MLTCMNSQGRGWTVLRTDPPTAVDQQGVVWLVCPVEGPECARIERARYSAQFGEDVMAVHVQIRHRPWS
jgi:hypothetical protein